MSSSSRQSTEAGVSTGTRILSACAGSAAVALIVTPLDVAKVRMQAASTGHSSARSACPHGHGSCPRECPLFYCSNGITEHCFHKSDARWKHCFQTSHPRSELRPGMLGTMRSIWREAGVAGLYAGLPITFLIAVPANVLYFATYEALRDWLQPRVPECGAMLAPLLAGGAGRAVAVTACSPLELVRTRMQGASQGAAAPGIMSTTAEILRLQGPRGLFRGLESTLWRDVPFSAGYWLGVETVRSHLLERGWFKESQFQSAIIAIAASSSAGASAAFVTTPFDVVKTRRQLEVASCGQPSSGLWQSMRDLARSEGPAALLTGSTPRVARVAPACGIMLGTYELAKQLLYSR
eukprot:TRINITY_DN114067_c0_g1_i1.p1 TRINITY_DN114067_c0_g1~~TRINITY_DN114067_c0_g1_i1.p1  ORF type:complete len:351 (-),score=33.98 TRINITY_DN114067_c0_g1_i1:126-1178(-)